MKKAPLVLMMMKIFRKKKGGGLDNKPHRCYNKCNKKREVKSMSEELLKELLNRIVLCQNNEINTYDCVDCPLYKTFGDGQNICLKIIRNKRIKG